MEGALGECKPTNDFVPNNSAAQTQSLRLIDSLGRLLAENLQPNAEIHKDLSGNRIFFPQKARQQVHRADRPLAKTPRLVDAVVDCPPRARCHSQWIVANGVTARLDDSGEFALDCRRIGSEIPQDVCCSPGPLPDDRHQQVLGSDVLSLPPPRFFFGRVDDRPRKAGEL
jgi:hypothetical protein